MTLPKLRSLDIIPVKTQNQILYAIKDPEGISQATTLFTPQMLFIAGMLDGKNDITDIQVAFAKRFGGVLLVSEEIKKFVEELDDRFLLETEKYYEKKKQIVEEFLESDIRTPYHAGLSYPAHPGQVATYIERFFNMLDEEDINALKEFQAKKIRAIIAPHIDYQRGGRCYALTYKILENTSAKIFILLGVAHQLPPVPYVITKKSFFTPLGICKTNQDIISYLQRRCANQEHEIAHRTEHSIELQLLFLKYVLDGKDFTIVPILCSMFEVVCKDKLTQGVEDFVQTLSDIVNKMGDEVCLIAGADLSHLGPRFGDPEPVSDALIYRMQAYDKGYLEFIEKGNAEDFYQYIIKDGNRNRVCGLGAIYTLLRVVKAQGKVLKYTYAHDPAGGVVSFASVAFAKST